MYKRRQIVQRIPVLVAVLLCYTYIVTIPLQTVAREGGSHNESDTHLAERSHVTRGAAAHPSVQDYDVMRDDLKGEDAMAARRALISSVCERYSQPSSPHHAALHSPPSGPGVETVLLPGNPPVSVCIPHKVGSHAWGEFARKLAALYPERTRRLGAATWRQRASWVRRAVVVRHPLDRLVSAYRMIFQDWCDKDKFIRGKWTTMCSKRGLSMENVGASSLERVRAGAGDRFDVASVTKMLSAVYDEFVYGQDRYIARIWYKYHPETVASPSDNMFQFSFQEFIRFLVNGTREFAEDSYVLKHKGISYHWDQYHKECPVCHSLTRPDYVLHMETLSADVARLLADTGLAEHAQLLPHTHTQAGGPSSQLVDSLVDQLQPDQLQQLQQLYQLDFELFGYQPRTL